MADHDRFEIRAVNRSRGVALFTEAGGDEAVELAVDPAPVPDGAKSNMTCALRALGADETSAG